ncbi:MAG: YfcE family phosphodiesterase [Candidatus Eremiobacteraeota bacterium]|nr:YfcE family phosphodiesterase [Candidatus Eremiobacteraeota bacterium]
MLKIGVISDTHGCLLPRMKTLFGGVDLILHAGDIGDTGIISELEEIAGIEAVFGNMDNSMVRAKTGEKIVLDKNGCRIGLAHGGGSPYTIIARLENMFRNDNVDIIVFGHTHSPLEEQVGDIFFFNPGDGRKTAGFLEIEEDGNFKTRIVRI